MSTFAVRQEISPEYLGNILTKDVTTEESIFELIDNAVDAARDRILQKKKVKKDKHGLPLNYSGYRIDLCFNSDEIVFFDNCSGITEKVLKDRAFVLGAMSAHPFGIGRFGIGLKRALFGLGAKYDLQSDTGKFAAQMLFNVEDLQRIGVPLTATEIKSSKKPRLKISISQLHSGVFHEVSAELWQEKIRQQISRRYGIFVRKGFGISVNEIAVEPFGPDIRSTKYVVPQSEVVEATPRVQAYIETGMHGSYRLQYEEDYSRPIIKKLTDQYGWYFVCNDRIVEVATRDKRLGWNAIWHQEYYGFVGWVHFVAADAQDLPWDTKKTFIDPTSFVFRAVSPQLQAFADVYKTQNKLERSTKTKVLAATSEKPNVTAGNTPSSNGRRSADHNAQKPSTSSSASHNQHWETLLPKMDVEIKGAKLSALVYEAERLNTEHCYSASLLFRSIIETALFDNLRKTRSLGKVQEMVYLKRSADDRTFTDNQKKNFRPSFRDALDWLGTVDDYFPEDIRRDCVFSRAKLKRHLQELNGIVHEGDLTNSAKIKTMRDDTMPLLNFLLEIR